VFAELPPRRVREYVEAEQRAGERLIAARGRVAWLASFAPAGLAEVRAVVEDAASTVDLDEGTVADLAAGLSKVLRVYAELGFESFNVAIHGAGVRGARGSIVLRVVARAYFAPLQRSDVMWSERLHAETATDLTPERLADRARELFAADVG
jgi:galactose-1-phosphate uridylyltransferase